MKDKSGRASVQSVQDVADPVYSAEACCGDKKKKTAELLHKERSNGGLITTVDMAMFEIRQDETGVHYCNHCGNGYKRSGKTPLDDLRARPIRQGSGPAKKSFIHRIS
jgi:hypothetical protein